MKINWQEVGRRIKKIRGKIKQSQFAELINSNQTKLSNYEGGKFPIPYEALSRLIDYCQKKGLSHVTSDWLLFGKNPGYGADYSNSTVEEKSVSYVSELNELAEAWDHAKEDVKPGVLALLRASREGEEEDISLALAPDPTLADYLGFIKNIDRKIVQVQGFRVSGREKLEQENELRRIQLDAIRIVKSVERTPVSELLNPKTGLKKAV